jgi:hypothetical protein
MSFDVTAGPFIGLAVFCLCGVLSMGGYSLRNSVEIRNLPYTNISRTKRRNDT